MSVEQFLRFAQSVLTMVDPDNPKSVEAGRKTVSELRKLASHSGKCDYTVVRMIGMLEEHFKDFCDHREEFAGIPGDSARNRAKRQRLGSALYPGC